MTKLTTRNLPDFYKQTVGFDRLFNEMERAFTNSASTGYPPYNIIRTEENKYVISVAVSGFDKSDLEVTQDGKKLVITGTAPEQDESVEYLHRGLAGRSFAREFTLADHVEITEVKLELGVLNVYLEQIIPDELLPRSIEIK